ncbi:serine/threonine protein kinase [Catenulispora acidiphila DSM 44928]|uniref:non-specific serine/threonine protein kinase n=1 Tax=Catenulispora acidiphila (strain DSM 44928 / JCM 14897 / NBRC 102108 / NRRL B-24433 / ID139908) TaxID=479433 RepID=C7PVR0_CATAD|nr:serine/threonine-protein kinase [Catenulispora acidiphila]ACU71302.1 serine/threonine protein kinase [Catenulispora acidiphila DSM 44928]
MAGWTVPGYTRIRVLGAGEAAGVVAGDGGGGGGGGDAGDAGLTVEAVHDASGARVVITYPGARVCSDEAFRDHLWQDTERLAELDQPNVVRVREVVPSPTGTELALVTEAVEGAALRRVLAISGPLPPEAALTVLRGSLLGLGAAAEAGVAHRDFQPSNVLITPEGDVKVGGFGLAARTGAMMPAAGTSSYMAPELWEGATPGFVTDVYAAAATFFECLTGRVPYTAESVFELQTMHRAAPIPVGDAPETLAPLLAQGLAKAPEERPASAEAFLAEVDAAAVVAFGLEWEERGRGELAALVAALPAEDAGGAGAAGAVAGGVGVTGTDSPAGAAMGRRTKAGIAAAVVAVVGVAVAAAALSPGKHSEAAVRPPGENTSANSGQGSSTDGGSSAGAAGVAPTPGVNSTGSTPSATTTGGPTTSTSETSPGSTLATTATAISVPLPTLNPLTSPPNESIPPSQLPPPTRPTGPGGSTAPPSSSSVTVTISASAGMTKGTYSGPCPPPEPPTATVTFNVSGLPSSGTVAITYHWRVTGDSVTGSGVVNAHNGSNPQTFAMSDDQQNLSGEVEITWTAPGMPGGTADAGRVDITCTPSDSSSDPTTSD